MPESTSVSPIPASIPTTKNPETPITLRAALPSDAKQISHLLTQTFTSSFGHSLSPSDLSAYLRTAYSVSQITSEILDPKVTIVVATVAITSPPNAKVEEIGNGGGEGGEEKIIGFVQLTEGTSDPCIEGEEKPIELQRLYVDGGWSGKGVGRRLMVWMERVAKVEKERRTLWLGVWEENTNAQAVYKKLGFKKVGEHDFKMGECIQRDWIMCKSL